MHVLAANSVATLLNYLQEQLQHTPSLAQIRGAPAEPRDDDDANDDASVAEHKVGGHTLKRSILRQLLGVVAQNVPTPIYSYR